MCSSGRQRSSPTIFAHVPASNVAVTRCCRQWFAPEPRWARGLSSFAGRQSGPTPLSEPARSSLGMCQRMPSSSAIRATGSAGFAPVGNASTTICRVPTAVEYFAWTIDQRHSVDSWRFHRVLLQPGRRRPIPRSARQATMYITLRGTPKDKSSELPDPASTPTGGRVRIAPAVIGLGTVSMLTDISSESVAAILPLYITVVVGLGPLAFGFIDGIYQGMSAVVRIAGGRWADRSDRPKWVAFAGYALSAVTRFGLLIVSGFWAITSVVAVDRLGKGLRTGPRDALIATASDPAHLGRNFGVHRAMDTAGALIGPLMAFAILAMFPIGLGGYQTVFVWSFAFAVVGVAVLLLVVPDLRSRSRAADADSASPAEAASADAGPADAGPADAGLAVAAAPPERPRWRDLANPGLRRLLIAAAVLSLVTIGDGFLYLSLQHTGEISASYLPLLFVGTNFAYLWLAVAIPLAGGLLRIRSERPVVPAGDAT